MMNIKVSVGVCIGFLALHAWAVTDPTRPHVSVREYLKSTQLKKSKEEDKRKVRVRKSRNKVQVDYSKIWGKADYHVQMIYRDKHRSFVLINNTHFRVGDLLDGWKITQIDSDRIELKDGKAKKQLYLNQGDKDRNES